MPINHIAALYLEAFETGAEFDGGLSYRDALERSDLDFSVESLTRIDALLDHIRTRIGPRPDRFIERQENVNFLYFLAFYVGEVVAHATQSAIAWYQYDEMLSVIPDNAVLFPRCFGSSLTCVFSGGRTPGGFFVPLAAIEERLYVSPPSKSVAFSAGTFMQPTAESGIRPLN